MCGQVWWPILWIWHIAVAPGEKLGVWFLLKGLTSVVVLKVEESAGYSLQNQNGLIIETV